MVHLSRLRICASNRFTTRRYLEPSGCPSQGLHDNAIHLEVTVGAQSSLKDIYLFRWRKPADFTASAEPFARCVQEFADANQDAVLSQVDLAPWRAYGPWDPQLARIVSEAIRATGGSPQPSPS